MFKEIGAELSGELREKEKNEPVMTIFLIRHGESGKDKSNPNRELTEKGKGQVRDAFNQVMESLLKEREPDFDQWDDEETKLKAIREAISDIEFHLRDSGTTRTLEQVWLEYDLLKELGVADENIYLPKSAFEHKSLAPDAKAGPGIAKRLKGVKGVDKNPDFRKLISTKEFQKKVGAKSDMMAWALTPEEGMPPGIEKRREMEERYGRDLASLEKVVNHKMENYPKRVVAIANSHASIATLAAARESGIPLEKIMEKIGEMPEAQGLRYDFYRGSKTHQAQPFGKDIERTIKELKG